MTTVKANRLNMTNRYAKSSFNLIPVESDVTGPLNAAKVKYSKQNKTAFNVKMDIKHIIDGKPIGINNIQTGYMYCETKWSVFNSVPFKGDTAQENSVKSISQFSVIITSKDDAGSCRQSIKKFMETHIDTNLTEKNLKKVLKNAIVKDDDASLYKFDQLDRSDFASEFRESGEHNGITNDAMLFKRCVSNKTYKNNKSVKDHKVVRFDPELTYAYVFNEVKLNDAAQEQCRSCLFSRKASWSGIFDMKEKHLKAEFTFTDNSGETHTNIKLSTDSHPTGLFNKQMFNIQVTLNTIEESDLSGKTIVNESTINKIISKNADKITNSTHQCHIPEDFEHLLDFDSYIELYFEPVFKQLRSTMSFFGEKKMGKIVNKLIAVKIFRVNKPNVQDAQVVIEDEYVNSSGDEVDITIHKDDYKDSDDEKSVKDDEKSVKSVKSDEEAESEEEEPVKIKKSSRKHVEEEEEEEDESEEEEPVKKTKKTSKKSSKKTSKKSKKSKKVESSDEESAEESDIIDSNEEN